MLNWEKTNELVNLLMLCVESNVGGPPYEFYHIAGDSDDPILHFWRLFKAGGTFKNGCYVVFSNIRDSDLWSDLSQAFHGSKFGSIFLMRVREGTPKVYPSQKGLYMT